MAIVALAAACGLSCATTETDRWWIYPDGLVEHERSREVSFLRQLVVREEGRCVDHRAISGRFAATTVGAVGLGAALAGPGGAAAGGATALASDLLSPDAGPATSACSTTGAPAGGSNGP